MADERRPTDFRGLLQLLAGAGIRFIVVGGVAAVLEGAPVSTFDLDIVYAKDRENIESLLEVLTEIDALYVDLSGRRIRPTAERLAEGGHHLLRTRFGRLDVLAKIGDGWDFEVLAPMSNPVTVHNITISVLGLEAVIKTKEAANRDKDRATLGLLRSVLAERESKKS